MEVVAQADRLAHVISQLASVPGKHQSDYTFISCPFHSEKTPSGRVFHSATTRSPGFFKCYGCGKTARWDELALVLNLQPFSSEPIERFSAKIVKREETEDTEELVFSKLPRDKKWRGIPTNLLHAIGSKVCQVDYGGVLGSKLVYLPVWVHGTLRGYVKARIKKEDDKPSYINKRGPWSREYGLFPFDYAVSQMDSTLVLVEGPRDALRLLALGIPAISILGTQSWDARKASMLETSGASRILLMMDGDDAGIDASEKIEPTLKPLFESVGTIKLWSLRGSPYRDFMDYEEPSKAAKAAGVSLWDPGNCPLPVLRRIRNHYNI